MLTEAKAQLQAFWNDEAGLSATEYAILFVVLLVFIVAGIRVLGPKIVELFNRAGAALDAAG
ncbi:MAG: Flp family type IVb pilin [Anaerolineales bacterium]|nr:Flp family type IVb pilin [Anaerolineales bacterium]